MIKEKAKFLAETNKLLQSIGSSEKIQTEEEKQSSLEYKFQSFLGRFANEKKTEKTRLIPIRLFILKTNENLISIKKLIIVMILLLLEHFLLGNFLF